MSLRERRARTVPARRPRSGPVALLVALALGLASLTGCGDQAAGSAAGSAEPSGAEPATASRPETPRPRLVILYVACTVNRSFLSPYSPEVAFTPAFAAFAEESVVFRRHVTECGQSGIDFATIFTGTQANRHGVYSHPANLNEKNALIAESFAAAGYDTFFWSGHKMAAAKLGYGQGVPNANVAHREKAFHYRPVEHASLQRASANDPQFRAILERLRSDPSYRAFVQIAFTASHEPYHFYSPREDVQEFLTAFPEASRQVTKEELVRWLAFYGTNRLALQWDLPNTKESHELADADVERLAAVLEVTYASCIHALDGYFGAMVKSIQEAGLAEQTLLSFTADHGELPYRENALFPWTHGLALAPEILDVPWILRAPGIAPGDYSAVTRSIDVFPTLAGLCGVEIPAAVQGVDLAPALRGERPAPRQLAFSHTPLWHAGQVQRYSEFPMVRALLPRRDPEFLSVRVRDEDLVVQMQRTLDGRFALQAFDLASDPGVAHDLYDQGNERHARLVAELGRYKLALIEGFAPGGAAQDVSDEEMLELLKDMGYAR